MTVPAHHAHGDGVRVSAHTGPAHAQAVHADSVRVSAHTGHTHAEAVHAHTGQVLAEAVQAAGLRVSAHTSLAAALPAHTEVAWSHPDLTELVHPAPLHAGCNHAEALPHSAAKAHAHIKVAPAGIAEAHSHAGCHAAEFGQDTVKVPAQTAHCTSDPADAVGMQVQDDQTGTDPANSEGGAGHTHPDSAQAADTASHADRTVGMFAHTDCTEAVSVGTWEPPAPLVAQVAILGIGTRYHYHWRSQYAC